MQEEIGRLGNFERIIEKFCRFLQSYHMRQLDVWGDWNCHTLRQNIKNYVYESIFVRWVQKMIDLQWMTVMVLLKRNINWCLKK